MILASVGLPAPFSPTKPWMLPRGISKSTACNTGVENALQIPLAEIPGGCRIWGVSGTSDGVQGRWGLGPDAEPARRLAALASPAEALGGSLRSRRFALGIEVS